MTQPQHFLSLDALDAATLRQILDHAHQLKASRGSHPEHLKGKSLAMIFEKHSTRTRISFEVAMKELGGHALILSAQDLQLGRGETIADTARVLSRYVHGVMMRAYLHDTLEELAAHATIPVINGLTDQSHPCQIMADLLTLEERIGDLKGKKVVWSGDGNNVLHSWIHAAPAFGYSLHIACPEALAPDASLIEAARARGGDLHLYTELEPALEGADAVVTDTWVSMGHDNSETRRRLLTPFQIDAAHMARAAKDAIFLHCLPAHRGEEVTSEVIDGLQSAVWDEAENRLHAQKAVLCWCFGVGQ